MASSRLADTTPSARPGRALVGPPYKPWNHKPDGFLDIAGVDVPPATAFDRTRLVDVAPTVLATFGLPRSDRMTGVVGVALLWRIRRQAAGWPARRR